MAHLTAAAQREEKQVPEPELGQEVAAAVQEWPSEPGQEVAEEVAEAYMEP